MLPTHEQKAGYELYISVTWDDTLGQKNYNSGLKVSQMTQSLADLFWAPVLDVFGEHPAEGQMTGSTWSLWMGPYVLYCEPCRSVFIALWNMEKKISSDVFFFLLKRPSNKWHITIIAFIIQKKCELCEPVAETWADCCISFWHMPASQQLLPEWLSASLCECDRWQMPHVNAASLYMRNLSQRSH